MTILKRQKTMKKNKEKFRLIGLKMPHKTTNQNNQSSKECGNLWQQFEKDNIFDLIPNKLSNEIYAVYYDYESDENGFFSYFIGCKVDETTEIPEGLTSLEIPSQNYEIITAKGVMTACITEVWEKIWNSEMERKFGFDFEVYDERSRDWNDAEVDIYVSVTT